MKSNEKAAKHRPAYLLPSWSLGALYLTCFFVAFTVVMLLVGALYSNVYSFQFVLKAVVTFGVGISLAIGLFTGILRLFRLPKGVIAVVSVTVLSIATILANFLPSYFAGERFLIRNYFTWSVILSLPVIVAFLLTAIAAYMIEEQFTYKASRKIST